MRLEGAWGVTSLARDVALLSRRAVQHPDAGFLVAPGREHEPAGVPCGDAPGAAERPGASREPLREPAHRSEPEKRA